MSPQAEWQAVRALFDAALALPAPERAAHVQASGAPAPVQTEVLSLLAHLAEDEDEAPDRPSQDSSPPAGFLAQPALPGLAAAALTLGGWATRSPANMASADGAAGAALGGSPSAPPNTSNSESPTVPAPAQPPRTGPGAEWLAGSLPPGTRLGAWEVTGLLGRGGMAEVHSARRADGAWEGEAAIKLIRPGMASGAVLARFALEQRALARLVHPHIARLLDAGRTPEGQPYFVMEKIAGQPIDAACTGQPLAQRLHWFLQLADAVAFAHRHLLVHRDLKPSNVLVDEAGQVKLLDFGIAKALDPLEQDPAHPEATPAGLTQAGQRPYTPHYASPEQVRGEPVGTGTDLYSLGVLLYLMLTGLRPYGRQARNVAEAQHAVLHEAPTRPTQLSPAQVPDPLWPQLRRQLRGDLENIVHKALEKAAERRYSSVEALAADVRAYQGGFAVSARAPRATYLLARFVARNRAAVGVASLGLAGVLAALGVALWQGHQAELARDQAQRQLASVQRMASELVFRYGDALTQLPGGAKAQEAVLTQTLAALEDALAAAPHNPQMGALVASVLGRLAQLQGNPAFAGPERARQAQATVARARALGDAVWPQQLGDWRFASQHLITLLTQAQLLRGQGQPAQGLQVLNLAAQRAHQSLASALPAEGHAAVLDLRANIWLASAQFHSHPGRPSLEQPAQALHYYALAEADFRRLYDDPALRAEVDRTLPPGEAPAAQWGRHNLANVQAGRALIHQQQGDDAAMRRAAQAAIALRRANLEEAPHNIHWRQSLMFDLGTLAIALLREDDSAAALAATEEAWRLAGQLLREAGPDGPWAQARASLSPHHGRALAAQGHPAQALVAYEPGLAYLEHALAAEPAHPALRQRLAWMRMLKAQALLALHQPAAAQALVQQSLASLNELLARADTPTALAHEARLARAESWAVQARLHPHQGAARQHALADLHTAQRSGPLPLALERLRQRLLAEGRSAPGALTEAPGRAGVGANPGTPHAAASSPSH